MNDYLSSNNKLVSVDEGFNRGNMFDDLYWPYKYIADLKLIAIHSVLFNINSDKYVLFNFFKNLSVIG